MPRPLLKMNNYHLIHHIKIRRALWDKTVWDKISGNDRELMWDEVANNLKSTKSIVKTRWKNLRDSYRKLLFRMLEDPTEPSIPKWRYFANMEFIRSIVLNTKSKVNDITLNQSPDMISVKAEFTTPCDGNMDDKLSEDPLIFSMEPSTSDIKMERMEKMHSPSMDSNSSHFLEPEIDTLPEKLTGYPNDDDLQFLLSLHPHLKHCSMNKKLILRMKIEKLVNDEVYSTGNGDNSLHDS